MQDMRENCPYSEFFWSVFSPNAGKYGSEEKRSENKLERKYLYF